MPSAPKWLFDSVEFLLPRLPVAEVAETVLLSPFVKKIRCKGDFTKLKFTAGTYIDFRVSDTEARRYTVSYGDTNAGILELIVHLHGKGSGSRFMDNLKTGDTISINAPRTPGYYDLSAPRVVIFGDESSLALARSFLPVLKSNNHSFQFYFELDEASKNVPELLGFENYTVFHKDGSFRNEAWISDLPVIRAQEWLDARFVLTGNVRSAQTFKKVVKSKTNGKVYQHGYWLEGKKGL